MTNLEIIESAILSVLNHCECTINKYKCISKEYKEWCLSVSINSDYLDKDAFLVNFLSQDLYKELLTNEFNKYKGFTFFDYECFISNLIWESVGD